MIYIPVTAEENCEVFLLEKRGMMFSSFTDNLCVLQMAILLICRHPLKPVLETIELRCFDRDPTNPTRYTNSSQKQRYEKYCFYSSIIGVTVAVLYSGSTALDERQECICDSAVGWKQVQA